MKQNSFVSSPFEAGESSSDTLLTKKCFLTSKDIAIFLIKETAKALEYRTHRLYADFKNAFEILFGAEHTTELMRELRTHNCAGSLT